MSQAIASSPDLTSHFEELQERGYTILPGILQPGVIEGVRADLKTWVDKHTQRLLDAGQIDDPHTNLPFEKRLAAVFADVKDDPALLGIREELHTPGMFDLFFCPQLLDLVEMILGPEIRLYPNYTVRPKLPDHNPTEVLWHQDGGYTSHNLHADEKQTADLRMVNVWSPLVPARPENGCMKFVPGTHLLGIVPHVEKKHYLEIAPDVLERYVDQAVDVILDPGDVVLFSNLLFHMGQPNRTDEIRWSCDWRYQEATQPTLRAEQGQLARSRAHPESVVNSPEQWAALSFG